MKHKKILFMAYKDTNQMVTVFKIYKIKISYFNFKVHIMKYLKVRFFKIGKKILISLEILP